MYTSAHTKLLADREAVHVLTPYSLLCLPCLLGHTEHVQSNSADTDIHIHSLSGDNSLLLTAGWTLGALRHRQNQTERSVEPVICVLDMHPSPQFLLTLIYVVSPDASCTISSLSSPLGLVRR